MTKTSHSFNIPQEYLIITIKDRKNVFFITPTQTQTHSPYSFSTFISYNLTIPHFDTYKNEQKEKQEKKEKKRSEIVLINYLTLVISITLKIAMLQENQVE